MDEMIFGSRLVKGLIERWIKKAIKRKIGYEVSVRLVDLMAKNDGNKVKLHIDGELEMESKEFEALIKSII